MDPALLRETVAFKKRALANPVIEKKPESKSASTKAAKTKKKKSKLKKPKPQPLEGDITEIKKNAVTKNPYRVLKSVVDLMRQRYITKNYEPIGLDEIITILELRDLEADTKQWLIQALKENAKIEHYPNSDKFLFKPSLGIGVRNRHQLLHKLQELDRDGLGGVLMNDIKEALPNPDKSIKKLQDNNDIMVILRHDKESIVFFNNKEYELKVDEEFIALWRAVGVDHLSEGDMEKYLQHVGLAAMQGEGRKRKAPGQKKPAKKKQRAHKILNTHLDNDLLKDYSEGASTS